MKYELKLGDCLDVLRAMPDCSVDSIVTDPPYGLSFMGKKWDYDVPSVEIWAECLRVLKPGGHLLAFAGTRTQHQMAVRIEDAGFEIRDMIAWVYGSGFPKSLDVSKAIDKAAGLERDRIPGEARQWDGWGTALKPALEPITVARKPFTSTVAANVLEHGTGALNVDGCRIESEETRPAFKYFDTGCKCGYSGGIKGGAQVGVKTQGRWPANLIHDGSDEVVGLFPQSTAGTETKERGKGGIWSPSTGTPAGPQYGDSGSAARFFYCAKASKKDRDEGLDSSRTVKHTTGLCKEKNMELAVLLQKATCESTVKWGIDESGESITGLCLLDSLSTTLTEISKITTSQICSLLTRSLISESTADAKCEAKNGGSHAASAGSSSQSQLNTTSESQAESALGVSHAVSKMLSSISDGANWIPATNFHATVKPTALMRYLCRLVTPPEGIVLDPFMGSGSTGKAAVLEGFEFIGIERDADYLEIATSRIQAAQDNNPLL
jgi:hypothetical protein